MFSPGHCPVSVPRICLDSIVGIGNFAATLGPFRVNVPLVIAEISFREINGNSDFSSDKSHDDEKIAGVFSLLFCHPGKLFRPIFKRENDEGKIF
jgi:hypothetical protein